ncbi:MAG: transcription antitermination factor NusB [Candidatus Faecisoma sp.]|jgi:N utilization substance protein B|nr:transcription antitermination factor NusB [Acholeplasma sp.]MCI5678163.1 transcription antitermination factor NusB [Acholeplasma sp.]MDY2892185.1 transcription antitermination factor NusB [Candidatus Faecisoma sp.]CCY28999.1 n utilization substance protein B homolog [Acholeplasma sp. CAG:878]
MELNRSELRKKIMTILYQMNVYDKNKISYNAEDVIKEVLEIDNEFVKDIVYGVITYKDELDSLANKYMNNWTIDRLGNTDIAILRMGIYELLYTNTPHIVSINEAVELAKNYSDDDVVKMINAVLDKIYKHEVLNER